MTTEYKLEADYTITEREYVQANSLYSRITKKQFVISLIVIIVLIILAYAAGDSAIRGGALGALIGGIGGYIINRFLIAPFRTKRFYRSYAAIKEPCTLKLQNEGVKFLSNAGEALIEWKHILKWRDDENFILIYQAPHLYHIVPKRLGVITDKLLSDLTGNIGTKS